MERFAPGTGEAAGRFLGLCSERDMRRRIIGALMLGLVGVAILFALGVWQVERLAWKQALLSEIEARIAAAPVPLPAEPRPADDRYLAVTVDGAFTGEAIDVLASPRGLGAGVRVVAAFESEAGRRILVDRGFIPDARRAAPRSAGDAHVTGNLDWPREVDRFTPEPDAASGLWFARDVPRMAAALATEPVLVVAREVTPADPAFTPLPVGTAGIPNDHLGYAITWFGLAAVWAGMTVLLVWRIRRPTDAEA